MPKKAGLVKRSATVRMLVNWHLVQVPVLVAYKVSRGAVSGRQRCGIFKRRYRRLDWLEFGSRCKHAVHPGLVIAAAAAIFYGSSRVEIGLPAFCRLSCR